jgi:hypothetical protein
MIKSMFFILFLNGFAGITISVIYTYITSLMSKQNVQDVKLEYLCQKICQLEKRLNELETSNALQETIKKDLQKYIHEELHTKLDDFIKMQYEVIE